MPKQYARHLYDPSSSGSPDILLRILLYYIKCKSRRREIIQPNIYRNLSKVNQIIYTLDTICEPTITIIAQVALQIFCWHGSIGLQCMSRKGNIIQSNIHWNLPKVNHVIYICYTIFVPNIMVLEQAVLQIYCWQDSTGLHCINQCQWEM